MCAELYQELGKRGPVFACGDGYTYYQNNVVHHTVNNLTVYVRCKNYRALQCSGTARIVVQGAEDASWFNVTGHVHSCRADPLAHQERRMRRELLDACRNNPYESPRQLLNRTAARYPVEVGARIRLGIVRFSMRRARMAQYPGIPATLPDLGNLLSNPMYQNLTSTVDGTDNIYAGTAGPPGESSVVFVSQRLAHWLRKVKRVFVDSTFVPTPTHPPGAQVFQVVTVVRNHVIPLVQAIMERRTFEAYFHLLMHIRGIAPQFHPKEVVLDHEKPQQDAWDLVYNPSFVSCYVHFIRACLKKAGSCGLKTSMRRNRRVERLFRCLMAIPLLPKKWMLRGFLVMVRTVLQRNLVDIRGVSEFFAYFIRTWMTGWRYHTLSVCGRMHRTNNPGESANRILRRETGLHHPNIWTFLNGLRNFEQSSFTDVVAFEAGLNLGSRRRLPVRRNDRALKNFTTDLREGNISIHSFLRKASRSITNLVENQL